MNVHWVDLPFTTVDMRETLNICEGCVFKQEHPLAFAPFEIVGDNPTPDVLFVAESPAFEEIKTQRPLIGKAGSLLRDVIEAFQLNSYALANVVSCHPTLKATNGKIRTPEDPEQEYCAPHVKAFIEQIQPKVIVLLGRIAAGNIFPNITIKDSKQSGFITKMTKKKPQEIDGVLYGASYHPSYILRSGGKTSDNYKAFLMRFKRILKEVIDTPEDDESAEDQVKITFHTPDDLETILMALEPYDTIGFDYEARMLDTWNINNKPLGIGLAHSTGFKKGRAYYIRLTRELTQAEKDLLLAFLKRKSPWAYNAKYENNLTWAWTGERVLFNDAFSLCKIDGSPASLKNNARKYLGADLWEEETQTIVGFYDHIFGRMKTYGKNIRRGGVYPAHIEGQAEVVDDYLKQGDYNGAKLLIDEHEKLGTKYKDTLEAAESLIEVIGYEKFCEGLTKYPYAWEAVPYEIMGEYCGWDAYYTVKLKEVLWAEYEKQYKYYITQTWLAGVMEAFGSCWNDDIATEHDTYYFTEALNCLLQLIDYLDVEDEARLEAASIRNDSAYESDAQRLKKMKDIFNPLSNKLEAQEAFWSAFRTPYIETCAMFYWLETHLLQDENLDDDTYSAMIDKTSLPNTVSNLVAHRDTVDSPQQAKEWMALTKILNNVSTDVEEYYTGYRGEVLEFHYDAMVNYGGIDIDDRDTWNTEFTMLYLLRRFKKVTKSSSTYIKGKVGREKVNLARVESVTKPPVRIANYFDVPAGYQLKENERWIYNTDFFENGAETKRWRAGIHTVPSMSELREIYVPRYAEDMCLHADYSQAEVRVMALLSGCAPLLEAFERGVDVHKFVASKVNKIEESEVSKAQRKAAKAATFGILYGKGVASFARDLMGGDIEAAQAFFAAFFAQFPEVKEWIEGQHQQVIKHGYVDTIFGDPIRIVEGFGGQSAMKRFSQNYPIQSSASSMSAYAIFKLYDKARRLGLRAAPVCFTHDSVDFDIAVADIMKFIPLMHEVMVDALKREFGVPCEIDWELGVSQNHTMELSAKGDSTYGFKCPVRTFQSIINKLETHFDVSYTIEEEGEEYAEMAELFMARRAFSKYFGEHIPTYEGTLTLREAA